MNSASLNSPSNGFGKSSHDALKEIIDRVCERKNKGVLELNLSEKAADKLIRFMG